MRRTDLRPAFLLSGLGVLTIATAGAALGQPYTVTDLGRLEGFDNNVGVAVNELGQVAGYSSAYIHEPPGFPYYIYRAIVYSDAVLTDLSWPPAIEAAASGINDLGQVTGWQRAAFEYSEGVIWEQVAGVWQITTQLGPLPGGRYGTWGADINNHGQVAGTVATVSGSLHAGLWESGTPIDLGTLPTGDWSLATAINERGEVAGYATSVGFSTNHAFLWLPNPAYGLSPGMNDLGTLGDRWFSRAYDVNDSGQVVGYSSSPDRGFVWESGVMTDLGPFAHGGSKAYGLNNLGQVVGTSWSTDPVLGELRACIWEAGVLYDLNDLLADASGWVIVAAYDVNDAGQIVGEGIHPSGAYHAVLLTPRVAPAIDLYDFAGFQRCFGPDPDALCRIAFDCNDADGVIDLDDYAAFHARFIGESVAPCGMVLVPGGEF